ncbi:hypothetical protein BGW41_004043 [Actinomortierella wolfii]|nr:hypothetical protein BGW41_004043 [Actinomortierella wolfii]
MSQDEVNGEINTLLPTNKLLSVPKLILSHEQACHSGKASPEVSSSGGESVVAGMMGLYKRLKHIKHLLIPQKSMDHPSSTTTTAAKMKSLPKLYFVKVDIERAFDTIRQDKLTEILQSSTTFQEERYRVQRHFKLNVSNGMIVKRQVPRVSSIAAAPSTSTGGQQYLEQQDSPPSPSFLQYAQQEAQSSKGAVLVDKINEIWCP